MHTDPHVEQSKSFTWRNDRHLHDKHIREELKAAQREQEEQESSGAGR